MSSLTRTHFKILLKRNKFFMLVLLLSFFNSAAYSADPLVNGGIVSGSISPAGNEDTFEFTGLTGHRVTISMVDLNGGNPNEPGNLTPFISLFSPDGSLITSDSSSIAAEIVSRTLPLNGTYTVVARSRFSSETGPYEIHYARAPGAQEHGRLVNGGSVFESLSQGDLDTFFFDGKSGETVTLTMADLEGGDPNLPGSLTPFLYLYDKNGTQITSASDSNAAEIISRTLPLDGRYTVLAKSRFESEAGPYELHMVKSPGAQEHGGLINGGAVSQTMSIGDLDSYTFYGKTGERVTITMADLNGGDPNLPGDLTPFLYLYGPTGSLITSDSDSTVAEIISRNLPLDGTYTLIAKTRFSGQVGPYEIQFARAPGAQEFAGLVSGQTENQAITLGDLDTYRFYAEGGDTISLTMTDLNGNNPNLPGNLTPFLYLYDPNGAQVTSASNQVAAEIQNRALTITGTYTVLAKTRFSSEIGPYSLEFTSTNTTLPDAVTLIGPSGSNAARQPALGWTPSGYARYYLVFIRDLSGNSLFRRIYRANTIGCAGGEGNCSIVPNISITQPVNWWIRPLNDFGFGQWSAPLSFSTVSGVPPRPRTRAPVGTQQQTTPIYEWSRIVNASQYRLLINDSTGARVRTLVSAAEAGCLNAGTVCKMRFDTSVTGNVTWYVRGFNSQGFGVWSAPGSFSTVQ